MQRFALTLIVLVPDVVRQENLAEGWTLVAGYERPASHSDWLKGNTTVQTYPAKGTHFPGWIVNYSYPGDVGFDLLLQPTKNSLDAWSFRAEAKRIGGTWKIASWNPIATFAPLGQRARVVGPNDLQPVTAGQPGNLHAIWLLVPVALVGGTALAAIAFGVARMLRIRARVREIQRTLESSR